MNETLAEDRGTTTFSVPGEPFRGRVTGNRVSLERKVTNPSAPPGFEFQRLYALVEAGESDQALDLIFEFFDDAFCSRRFVAVDQVLGSVDLARLDAHSAYGLLTASYPARESLPARVSLCDRVAARLMEHGRSEADVRSLLRGLR